MLHFIRDCHTATLHLEQARGSALAWRPRLRLWLHLLSCSHCRRYARQSRQLEELARLRRPPAAALPDSARQQLQARLRAAGF